jgi:autotransporter-associated beta strand protein
LQIGINNSGQQPTIGTIDLMSGIVGTSTFNALISGGTIGTVVANTNSANGTLIMGAGTLDAISLLIGQSVTSASNTGSLSVNGGIVKVGTMTMGDQRSTGVPVANFTLNGLLLATTVQAGAVTGGTVAAPKVNFNWTSGTIANYNSGSGLTVSVPTITMDATGSVHTLSIDANQTGTINSVIAEANGIASLVKTGAGTAVLTASNTYTGNTTINQGTLTISGSGSINGSNGTISVTGAFLQDSTTPVTGTVNFNQGTIGGSGNINAAITVPDSPSNIIQGGDVGAGTLSLNSLTFNGAGQIRLWMGSSFLSAGTLTANGSAGAVVINYNGAAPGTAGLIPLVGYSSLGGTGTAGFALGVLPPRYNASLDFNTPGLINLNLLSVDHPIWTGSQNTQWTTSAVGGNQNWRLAVAGTGTDFVTGDNVVFDDTAAGSFVQITGSNVQPNTVTFSNNALNYTIAGPYGIADSYLGPTTVTLSGEASVTLATSGTYTGGTNILPGATLQLGSSAGNGSVVGAVTNNGQLIINNPNSVTLSATISGSGSVLHQSGTTTISGNNSYAGGTTLNGGELVIGSNSAIGTGTLVVNGGKADFNNAAGLGSQTIVINGGKLDNTSTAAITMTGNNPQSWTGPFEFVGTQNLNMGIGIVTLTNSTGDPAVAVDNGTLTVGRLFSIPLSGIGLTKTGTGTLALNSNSNNGVQSNIGGVLNVVGGTLAMNVPTSGSDLIATGLTGSGTIINNGLANRWLKIDSTTIETFSGVLANGGAATLGLAFDYDVVASPGMLTLTGSNTYSGPTSLAHGGILQLGTGVAGQDGSINNTSQVWVNGTNPGVATLVFNLAGSQTAAYPIGIAGNAALALIKKGTGTLTLSGTNNLYANGTTVYDGNLIVTNPGAIADGTSLTVGNDYTFPAPVVASPVVSPVPEPGTLALFAACALGAAAARKRLRRK